MKTIIILSIFTLYLCHSAIAEEDFHHWRTTPPTTPCPTVTTTRCPAVQEVSEQMDRFFGTLDGGNQNEAAEIAKMKSQFDELIKIFKFHYCQRHKHHQIQKPGDIPDAKPGESLNDWYKHNCCHNHQLWCTCGKENGY